MKKLEDTGTFYKKNKIILLTICNTNIYLISCFHRLIKGDGEVLEELVSRERHKEINKQATKGDGEYFQARMKANVS